MKQFYWGLPHKHKGFTVFGWQNNAQKNWYRNAVNKISNGIIVEVGVFGGASLLSIVDVCVKNNNKLYGVDPWELANTANGKKLSQQEWKIYKNKLLSVRKNLENIITKLNYSNTVSLVKDFSPKASDKFEKDSIDLIYIDGDHAYKSVLADLNGWMVKLKPGAFIWGDDFNWPNVAKAVKDYCKENKIEFTHTGRSWFIKKNLL